MPPKDKGNWPRGVGSKIRLLADKVRMPSVPKPGRFPVESLPASRIGTTSTHMEGNHNQGMPYESLSSIPLVGNNDSSTNTEARHKPVSYVTAATEESEGLGMPHKQAKYPSTLLTPPGERKKNHAETFSEGNIQGQGGSVSGRRQHIATESAKLCIRALRDSADAFPPLKSLVGGITFFIDNYEKWQANKENLERLVSRISRLAKSSEQMQQAHLAANPAEKLRRDELERKFVSIAQDLQDLQNGNQALKYVMANDEHGVLLSITEDINTAIVDYQLLLQQETNGQLWKLIKEADMNTLDRLPRAKDAGYQSREPNAGCEPGTRIAVLNRLENWANNRDPGTQQVYWLNGHAGSGKSTIAHTFCQRLYANGQLGASFFCSRDFSERSDIKLIFPTLAFQLACRYPSFCSHLVKTLKTRPDLANESLNTQLTDLLVKPLQASDVCTTILIDALDESKDQEPASTILSLLSRVIEQIPKVKFFITGRPEIPIRTGFRIPALKPHTEIIILHELAESDVDGDISLYIHARLSSLVANRSDMDVSHPWPSLDQVNALVEKSAQYFIFASTCVKMISSPTSLDPIEVLERLTKSTSTVLEGKNGIDDLYTYILKSAFSPTLTDSVELKLILGTITLSYNPLSSQELSALLDIPRLSTRLRPLYSLLLVPSNDSIPIRIHHKSFPDYLTDHQRCSDDTFYVNPTIYHAEIAIACLNYMEKHLRKNICSLPRYAMNSVIPITTRRECIGKTLEYACRFWAQHVCQAALEGEHMSRLLPVLSEFLQRRQILWLEVLSLIDNIHHCVASLKEVGDWLIKITMHSQMKVVQLALRWLEDGLCLVLRFVDCIRESAWHLYHSALPLSPTSSLLRIAHSHDLVSEGTVLRGIDYWDAPRAFRINTVIGYSQVTFSQNGNMLAAISRSECDVFNVVTGECLHKVKDMPSGSKSFPSIVVKFVANDSMLLAGGWHGATLWDLQTGSHIRNYEVPNRLVPKTQVDMSPDQYYIALAQENTVYVWETASEVLFVKFDIDCPKIPFIGFTSFSDSILICYNGEIDDNLLAEDVSDKFECAHAFDEFAISYDRSLLSALVSASGNTQISLYDTKTGDVIWTHQSDGPLHVVLVLPDEHTLWMFGETSLQVADYTTASPVETILEHRLPPLDLHSAVLASNRRYFAYSNFGLSAAYIHQLWNYAPAQGFNSATPHTPYSSSITLDGTTAIVWQRGSTQIRVCGIVEDVALEAPEEISYIFSATLTPNRKFVAITGNLEGDQYWRHDFLVTYCWNLNDSSLAWIIYLPNSYFCWPMHQFVDDETYVIISVGNPYYIPFGFSSSREDTTRTSSVAGVTGSSWHLTVGNLSVCSVKIQVSQLDNQEIYHLNATEYMAPKKFPAYALKCLDDDGWLVESRGHKILWIPHDSRSTVPIHTRRIWGTKEIMVTSGTSGVITAMDFSSVGDIEILTPHGWTDYEEEVAECIRNLRETFVEQDENLNDRNYGGPWAAFMESYSVKQAQT